MEPSVKRNSIQFLLSSHLLNFNRLLIQITPRRGRKQPAFIIIIIIIILTSFFPRFPSLDYKAIFVHKKEKIRIIWHTFLAFLADISFSRLILAWTLTSVNRLLRK